MTRSTLAPTLAIVLAAVPLAGGMPHMRDEADAAVIPDSPPSIGYDACACLDGGSFDVCRAQDALIIST